MGAVVYAKTESLMMCDVEIDVVYENEQELTDTFRNMFHHRTPMFTLSDKNF